MAGVSQQRFTIDFGWKVLLNYLDIPLQDLLMHAQVPLDLFSHEKPSVSVDEYYRLWEGLLALSTHPNIPLHIGQSISVKSFNPVLFACFCSQNLGMALQRLAQYKPLIGPMRINVALNPQHAVVSLGGLPDSTPPPYSLMCMELVFMVHMGRLATRKSIVPLSVHMVSLPPDVEPYEEFFGTAIVEDTFDGLVFSAEDASQPFLTANDAMWSAFEPELQMRLSKLGVEASFRERVRACLLETIAGGSYAVADVAQRLAVSPRTLQRRLRQEGTTFQQELSSIRAELARHYLRNTRYSSSEISFLLGYEDPNSFVRAYHDWTGMTPGATRQMAAAN